MSDLKILFEHDHFIIVNKPCGMASQGDRDQIGICARVKDEFGIDCFPCHRLDKATSGLMILATSVEANKIFSYMFAEKEMNKTYLAIAKGKPKKKQGKIVGDMDKSRRGQWRLLRTKENPAITTFNSISMGDNRRLYVLTPKTGKTHQLRVALSSLGCAISGDTLYGGETLDQMHLHAYKLEFEYMSKQYSFKVEPESELFLRIEDKVDIQAFMNS
jgi:tRNA pseudouridine32 synthase / 23S rRNA pseudouridine746 synthase